MKVYSYSFNKLLIWTDGALFKSQTPSSKNPNTKYEKQDLSKRLWTCVPYFCYTCYPPEVEGRPLLLRTPGSPETGPRDTCPRLDIKSPSWGLAFIVPEVTIYVCGGEATNHLPGCSTYEPKQGPSWHITLQVQSWHSHFGGNRLL